MASPILRQLLELTPEDFATYPIWIGCHVADYDEPWFDDTDEETFRPWLGERPVDQSDETLLVRADAKLADGSKLSGFLTPSVDPSDVSSSHPHAFVGERAFGFWSGVLDTATRDASAFQQAVGSDVARILPITFTVDDDVVTGGLTVIVEGWSSQAGVFPKPNRSRKRRLHRRWRSRT